MSTHICRALVLTCIDFRLQGATAAFIHAAGLTGTSDRVAVAGAAKSLVTPDVGRDREFLLRQIEIAASLHHISEVIVIQHEDCGAYGGSSAFTNAEAEIGHHRAVMQEAKALIARRFPTLTIRFAYARLNEDHPSIDFLE